MAFLVHPKEAVGEYIGEYQILSCLGIGKTGATYHVKSHKRESEFALKIFRIPEDASIEWVDKLEIHLGLLSKLNHLHLNRVLQTGKWESLWYVVKELVHDGEGNTSNLSAFVAQHQGKLSPYQLYYILKQLGSAFQYLGNFHDGAYKGLVHGNLTPENVLISWKDAQGDLGAPLELSLTDPDPFHIFNANFYADAYSKCTQFGTQQAYEESVLPTTLGALAFLSPECLREGGERCDFYSLGQLLYLMATGNYFFPGAPALSTVREDFSIAWDNLLENLLDRDSRRRLRDYQKMQDLMESSLAPELNITKEKAAMVPPSVKTKKRQGALTPIGMCYIPKGDTLIGNAKCGDDALPQHLWETEGFYMDRTLVTNRQFNQFVEETSYETEAEKQGEAPIWLGTEWRVLKGVSWRNPIGKEIPKDFMDHPVCQVTYQDAQSYAEWLGRRLPTEEEWEYAAKGGLVNVDYPWGNQISREHAHYSAGESTSVMNYPPNGYGLYDMAGNLWEWTSSWYQAYPGNLRENPNFGEKYRVVRGGAWLYDAFHCHLSYRNANQPEANYPTVGFRTVCDVPQKR